MSILGNGVVIGPWALLNEIDEIKKNGNLNIAEFMQICQFENDGYYLKNKLYEKPKNIISFFSNPFLS